VFIVGEALGLLRGNMVVGIMSVHVEDVKESLLYRV
jgi:hypothetical protein